MKVTLNHANFLACLVILFFGLSVNNAIAQVNRETAAQMVEIGD